MTVQSPRILVVDDDEIHRIVALRLLEHLGHEAEVVNDGLEALEAFCRQTFDLVLMDCQMPGLDGYEATRRLRQRGIVIPIVAYTALKTAVNRSRCLAAGMNDFLPKPCGPAEMEAVLSRWLRPRE